MAQTPGGESKNQPNASEPTQKQDPQPTQPERGANKPERQADGDPGTDRTTDQQPADVNSAGPTPFAEP